MIAETSKLYSDPLICWRRRNNAFNEHFKNGMVSRVED